MKAVNEASELYWKYFNTHSYMSRYAAKQCALLEVQGRVEELNKIPGTEGRVKELELVKEKIVELYISRQSSESHHLNKQADKATESE
ncbi:MAG: hypothetical protein WKF97_15240 [Chitinophagaceae bacterium]